jgi:hypothetical protein
MSLEELPIPIHREREILHDASNFTPRSPSPTTFQFSDRPPPSILRQFSKSQSKMDKNALSQSEIIQRQNDLLTWYQSQMSTIPPSSLKSSRISNVRFFIIDFAGKSTLEDLD